MKTKTTPSIYIDKVDVKNFRLFSQFETTLNPQLTVFIAPNSGGKTAILDAVGGMLKSYVGHAPPQFEYQGKDIRNNAKSLGQEYPAKRKTPNWVKLELSVGQEYLNSFKNIQGGFSLEKSMQLVLLGAREPGLDLNEHKNIKKVVTGSNNMALYSSIESSLYYEVIDQTIQSETSNTLPLFVYFSANRRVVGSSKFSIKNDFELSRKRALTALLPCDDLQDFGMWLRERAITGLEERLEVEQENYETETIPDAHLKAVSSVLTSMLEYEVDVSTVKYFSRSKDVQAVKKNGERFDIEQLSHGAKSVLTIAAKLAMHCCALNPHLKENAPAETPGIVLIDEIDLHLHPRWQQHILEDLTRCFPMMQFIVTTHSPAVLTTVKRENIREIRVDNETGVTAVTEPLGYSYGKSVADAMEMIMEVPSRPDIEFVRKVSEYLNWAENGDLSEDRLALRSELNNYPSAKSDLRFADMIINRRHILSDSK